MPQTGRTGRQIAHGPRPQLVASYGPKYASRPVIVPYVEQPRGTSPRPPRDATTPSATQGGGAVTSSIGDLHFVSAKVAHSRTIRQQAGRGITPARRIRRRRLRRRRDDHSTSLQEWSWAVPWNPMLFTRATLNSLARIHSFSPTHTIAETKIPRLESYRGSYVAYHHSVPCHAFPAVPLYQLSRDSSCSPPLCGCRP